MAETKRLIYQGPPPFVSMLAQILREEGAQVDYDPPIARDVIVDLTASGMGAAITLALQKFREQVKERATVREEDGDDDD